MRYEPRGERPESWYLIMGAWLSAAAGAIVTGVVTVLVWLLNRKAAKNDKRNEQEEADKKAAVKRFEDAVAAITDFASELGLIKADMIELKENNRRQDEERKMDKAYDARRRILQFADEIRRGIRHSLEHFNDILDDITYYTKYCDEHPSFQNDKAVRSIQRIEEVYDECMRNNDFL